MIGIEAGQLLGGDGLVAVDVEGDPFAS